MTVCCVLRSGGPTFGPRWVRAIYAAVREHAPGARFVCLTDVALPGIPHLPLVHDWPKWWAKVEMWRPGLFSGTVLYLDLDTLVMGDLSPFSAYGGRLAFLSDLYQPRKFIGSGVVLFDGSDPPDLYDRFRADPAGIMAHHTVRSDYWYQSVAPTADRIQALYPGMVCSYKADARQGPPAGAALVCGHGEPRFSDPAAGWAHEHWKRLAA